MNGVMLAFLPTNTEWCKQELPHMTLVYCGTTEEVSEAMFSDIAKDSLLVANMMRHPFSLDVTGVEVFGGNGDGPKVDVLRLGPTPQLVLARRLVQHWNASQHPFNPHATVGPEGSAEGELPTQLFFDRILASWGPKKLIFRLGLDRY
jgi:2'-5' RNA ligase